MNDLNPLELICTFLCGKSSSAAAGDEGTPAFAEQCCVDRVVVYTMWNQTKWYHDDQRDTVVDFFLHLLNCTVLGVTLTLGLPGNLWVCWLVFKTRSLQTSDNALLVSLAVSDLLKCSVDTPLLLFSFLSYSRKDGPASVSIPMGMCTLQQFTYALCCCVQLLTLAGISVERFQAIAFPFQTERRKARVRVWIPSIWLCGLILAAVSLTLSSEALFYLLCYPHLVTEERLQHPDPFGTYVLVPVWCLSIILIVVHYTRIFKVVRNHRRNVFSRGVQLRSTVSNHVWAWLSAPQSARRVSSHGFCGPAAPRRSVVLVVEPGEERVEGTPLRAAPEIVGAVCLITPGARERGKKRMEGKVAQRFGYIIVAFTLFWTPLVIILLLRAMCRNPDKVSTIFKKAQLNLSFQHIIKQVFSLYCSLRMSSSDFYFILNILLFLKVKSIIYVF